MKRARSDVEGTIAAYTRAIELDPGGYGLLQPLFSAQFPRGISMARWPDYNKAVELNPESLNSMSRYLVKGFKAKEKLPAEPSVPKSKGGIPRRTKRFSCGLISQRVRLEICAPPSAESGK